ncbi:hypothetical protein CPC08DRAFT_678943 [Agrocybe pediades]|nr:hypothetical protein CPC08DRAFT_678943 [Agrocybe pediades]
MKLFINGSCHCEANEFRVEVDNPSLPVSDSLCHCNVCRHATGQMAARFAQINGFLAPPVIEIDYPKDSFNLGGLTAYKSSSDVTRYFCSSCSSHLFRVQHTVHGDRWGVAVGSLEKGGRVSKISSHIWVRDTLDGGLADHLTAIDGVRVSRYEGALGSKELRHPWKHDSLSSTSQSSGNDSLKARCHCGSIQFTITRPSEASFEPFAPFPDLLFSHLYSHLSKISNPKDTKWWLCPAASPNPSKYLAGHCLCNVCRLNSGFAIQSWAFVPLANIVQGDSSNPLSLDDGDGRPMHLKQYITSTGNYREFCDICGATAFSWQAAVPSLISVSVGLLDEAENGARAENWLQWHKTRIGFQESAQDQSLARGLLEGLAQA